LKSSINIYFYLREYYFFNVIYVFVDLSIDGSAFDYFLRKLYLRKTMLFLLMDISVKVFIITILRSLVKKIKSLEFIALSRR